MSVQGKFSLVKCNIIKPLDFRITSMVEKLCTLYGDTLAEVDGTLYYDFPPIAALADSGVEEKLKESGFGYRAKFIHQSAVKIMEFGGMNWLLNLQKLPYTEAKLELMKLPGIGAKVCKNYLSLYSCLVGMVKSISMYIALLTPVIYKLK